MWKSTQRLLTVPPISNNKQTKDYFRATALVDGILLVLKKATLLEKKLWKLQYKTSRTSICGMRCTSREELREHTEEHVTTFKAKTVSGWEEPSLFFCYSFRPYNSGFDLSSCTTRWVCYLTSLRRNTRPWWVSFFLKSCQKLTFWLHTGKNVPFKAFGFTSTYDFLQSLPEAVRIILLLFPRNSESPFLTSASF